jgi:hypothetical protein
MGKVIVVFILDKCLSAIDIDNIDTGPLYDVSVHSWATKLGS